MTEKFNKAYGAILNSEQQDLIKELTIARIECQRMECLLKQKQLESVSDDVQIKMLVKARLDLANQQFERENMTLELRKLRRKISEKNNVNHFLLTTDELEKRNTTLLQ